MDAYYGLVGTLLFVAFLAYLFIRMILGYATPPIPTRAYDLTAGGPRVGMGGGRSVAWSI